MFFLIDLSDSKMDNKDELMKVVNRTVLLLLDCIHAEHLIEVMMIMLEYTIKNNLNKKLGHLLTKCLAK